MAAILPTASGRLPIEKTNQLPSSNRIVKLLSMLPSPWLTLTMLFTILLSFPLLGYASFYEALNDNHWWMGSRGKCAVALHQGLRAQQEDRFICLPELLLPGRGSCIDDSIRVGLFGIFDGHNGAEGSEFASIYLPYLLYYHMWSIMSFETNWGQFASHSNSSVMNITSCYPANFEKSMNECIALIRGKPHCQCRQPKLPMSLYRMLLKEALLRALLDIDSAFESDFARDWQSGSTAIVVLIVGRKLLAANIGDSKAFVCSTLPMSDGRNGFALENSNQHAQISSTLLVKALTSDHHPDRLDEKRRIEAAGGFVSTMHGVARVNGVLAVSRAIGDTAFKRFGVIVEPEFSEWMELAVEDKYLVITSDGIFERLKLESVCNLLHESITLSILKNEEKLNPQFLADLVIESALKSGSFDNLATIVYPLGSLDPMMSLSSYDNSASSFTTFSSNIEDIHSVLLAAGKDQLCYELIERAASGIILPVQTSNIPLSAITLDAIEDENVIVVTPDRNNHSNLPYIPMIGTFQTYQDNLVCLQRPSVLQREEICFNQETFTVYLKMIAALPLGYEDTTKAGNLSTNSGIDPTTADRYKLIHERYILKRSIGRGGFGEIWFAVSKNCTHPLYNNSSGTHLKATQGSLDSLQHIYEFSSESFSGVASRTGSDSTSTNFILKRILVEKGHSVYLSGIREKYFGEIFLNARKHAKEKSKGIHHEKNLKEIEDGLDHIVRYVESYQGSTQEDLWLIFHNEGYSLSSMLYTTDSADVEDERDGHVRILKSSNWWKWLKTTEDGQKEMRFLIYQLLLAVQACHSRNITHRDIKPENMMVRATSHCPVWEVGQLQMDFPCNLSMRLIDFGSAINPYSLQHLYGLHGPSRAEQTEEYTPPESFLQRNWLIKYGTYMNRYDMWSIGVIMLELVLGTPHVFQISSRTKALIDQQLEGWGSSALDTAYILRALMELCILYPGTSGHYRLKSESVDLASWKCTEENLIQQIKERDPLGIGFEDIWALRLLRGLLQWYPEDRISVEDALKHPYFISLQGQNR